MKESKPKNRTSDFLSIVKSNEDYPARHSRNQSKKDREDTADTKQAKVKVERHFMSSIHNKNSKSTNFDFPNILAAQQRNSTFKVRKHLSSGTNLFDFNEDKRMASSKQLLVLRENADLENREKINSIAKQSRKSVMVINDGGNLRKINIEKPNPFDALLKNDSVGKKQQSRRESSFKVGKLASDKLLQNIVPKESIALPAIKSNTLLSNNNIKTKKLSKDKPKKTGLLSMFQCFGCK